MLFLQSIELNQLFLKSKYFSYSQGNSFQVALVKFLGMNLFQTFEESFFSKVLPLKDFF